MMSRTPHPGTESPARASAAHAINERSGREKRAAQLAGNPGAYVRASDDLHTAES